MSLKYIIFPPICVSCNDVIKIDKNFDESFICKNCLIEAREYIVTEDLCVKCRKPIDTKSKQQVKEEKCEYCL